MVFGGRQLCSFVRQYISDVLFPVFCLGCRTEGEWVCRSCLARAVPLTETSCFSCDRIVVDNACCDMCRQGRCVDVYWSLYSHHIPLISDVIEQLKYHGASDVVHAVSLLCAQHQYVRMLVDSVDVVIPVPLHPVRFRERGFNQSQYIAQSIGEILGVSVLSFTLIKTKQTKQQARLSLHERKENVVGAFTVLHIDAVLDQRVLLVDDVLTTGSTVDACARELMSAGARSVCVLTLARG